MGCSVSEGMYSFLRKHEFISRMLFPLMFWKRRRSRKQREHLDEFYKQLFETVEGGSLVTRINDFPGVYEIDIRSSILSRVLIDKKYEPETVELIKKYIDSKRDVVDVGANVGLYTVLFSMLIAPQRKVLSIEPTPLALGYLRQNIKRNACLKSVIVFEGIASDKEGKFRLNVIPGIEEYSSLGQIVHWAVQDKLYNSIEIKGNTLDHLVKRFGLSPGLLKIDTEGAEYKVLSGALTTLRKHKPVIICELSDNLLSIQGANSKMVIDLLKQNGYNIKSVENPNEPINTPYEGDIVAVPLVK